MPRQLIFFDQPRSASHLLARILSTQPNVKLLDHPFAPGRGPQLQWLGRDNYNEGMAEDTRLAFEAEIEKGLSKWKEALKDVRDKGQTLMLHDHPFTAVTPDTILDILKANAKLEDIDLEDKNFTMIPDDLMLQPGTTPVLTIRDPRLAVPSAYRVLKAMGLPHGGGRPNFLISTTPLWNRLLYGFFVSKGIEPVIVDADDVMTSSDFIRQLCVRLGLDPTKVYLSWTPPSDEEKKDIHPAYYASQCTLIESSGIDPDRAAKNKDLEAEQHSWEAEFGEDVGLVREMVDLAMPHYQYLCERRFTI